MMERDHCLVAGLMLTPILLSELNTNCPTASRPGLDMFLSLTQDTCTPHTIIRGNAQKDTFQKYFLQHWGTAGLQDCLTVFL